MPSAQWIWVLLTSLSVCSLARGAAPQEACQLTIGPKTTKISHCFDVVESTVPTEVFKIQLLHALRRPSSGEAIIKRSVKLYQLQNLKYRQALIADQKKRGAERITFISSFLLNSDFDSGLVEKWRAEIAEFNTDHGGDLPKWPSDFKPATIWSTFTKETKHVFPLESLPKNDVLKSIFSTAVYRKDGLKPDDWGFITIPAGEVNLGSTLSDKRRFREEKLTHFELKKPFSLQKSLLSQSQWLDVMGSNPSRFNHQENCADEHKMVSGQEVCPSLPVESITEKDIRDFIKLLSLIHPKEKFRLPTAAELEYAFRGGKYTTFWFGDDLAKAADHCWIQDNSNRQTHPVNSKDTNPFGLYGSCGNSWQLATGPYGYLLKGGSWTGGPRIARPATSLKFLDGEEYSNVSFRMVRD